MDMMSIGGVPWQATAAAGAALLAALIWGAARLLRPAPAPAEGKRRVTPAQVVATLAALICTAIGADTAWRFAEHSVGIEDELERGALFLAGEVILLGCALAARENVLLRNGRPGVPGALVWVISGFLTIPAFTESTTDEGLVLAAALWRSVLGPIGAALMWHLAMGLELRTKTGGETQGFVAVVVRRAQRKVLSWMGVSVATDQSAEEMARARTIATAARRVDRYESARWEWRKRQLARKVGRGLSGAGVPHDDELKARLHAELEALWSVPGLAARKSEYTASGSALLPASALPELAPAPEPETEATVPVPAPAALPQWDQQPEVPAPAPVATREPWEWDQDQEQAEPVYGPRVSAAEGDRPARVDIRIPEPDEHQEQTAPEPETEEQQVERLFRSDLSIRAAAEEMGVSVSTAHKRFKRLEETYGPRAK